MTVAEPMVTCAGGLNVDRILRLDKPAIPGTSNPGTTTTTPGGVARNIADGLARAGVPTALFGAVGHDDDGQSLIRHALELGIDTAPIVTVDHPTGSYTAIIDPDGSLVIGVSDMAATESIGAEHHGAVESCLARSAWLILDTNLPAGSIAALAEMAADSGCRVAANTVSVAKSGRVNGIAVDLLFASLDEAEALADLGTHTSTELSGPEQCKAALSAADFPAAVVTVGPDGAWYYDADSCGAIPGVPTDAADTTGAGDALVGETIRRLMGGADLATAVAGGVAVAAELIRHVGAAGRRI